MHMYICTTYQHHHPKMCSKQYPKCAKHNIQTIQKCAKNNIQTTHQHHHPKMCVFFFGYCFCLDIFFWILFFNVLKTISKKIHNPSTPLSQNVLKTISKKNIQKCAATNVRVMCVCVCVCVCV